MSEKTITVLEPINYNRNNINEMYFDKIFRIIKNIFNENTNTENKYEKIKFVCDNNVYFKKNNCKYQNYDWLIVMNGYDIIEKIKITDDDERICELFMEKLEPIFFTNGSKYIIDSIINLKHISKITELINYSYCDFNIKLQYLIENYTTEQQEIFINNLIKNYNFTLNKVKIFIKENDDKLIEILKKLDDKYIEYKKIYEEKYQRVLRHFIKTVITEDPKYSLEISSLYISNEEKLKKHLKENPTYIEDTLEILNQDTTTDQNDTPTKLDNKKPDIVYDESDDLISIDESSEETENNIEKTNEKNIKRIMIELGVLSKQVHKLFNIVNV